MKPSEKRHCKRSWDTLSDEYYSEAHRTSRNFDKIIDYYLPKMVPSLIVGGLYLDVGAGKGRLWELYKTRDFDVITGDFSVSMMKSGLNEGDRQHQVQMDAFEMPLRENIFNGVFSLLGDPYSLQEAFREVFRVLKLKGFFFIAIPAKIWADNIRPILGVEANRTIFKTQTGRSVKVPSFLYKSKDLKEVLMREGFKKVKAGNWQPSGLISRNQFSRDILISAASLGIPPEELPLITYALAHKTE